MIKIKKLKEHYIIGRLSPDDTINFKLKQKIRSLKKKNHQLKLYLLIDLDILEKDFVKIINFNHVNELEGFVVRVGNHDNQNNLIKYLNIMAILTKKVLIIDSNSFKDNELLWLFKTHRHLKGLATTRLLSDNSLNKVNILNCEGKIKCKVEIPLVIIENNWINYQNYLIEK